jgi:protein-disulfide isomerase
MKTLTMKRLLKNTLVTLGLSLILYDGATGLAQSLEPDMIAILNGEPIYLSEIEQNVAFQVYRLRGNIYTLLQRETEEIVNQKLLAVEASRKGLGVGELLKKEVDEKVKPPGEKEVDEYLATHPEDAGKDPQKRNKIRTYLFQKALIQRKLDYMASLREKADYKFLLKPPERPRIKVVIDGEPWQGNLEAPVTLVHFADLTSKVSSESAEKIRKLLTDFPDKVKWVHRNCFRIQDDRALLAAEMGEAALEQGLFWNFHDLMFSKKGDMKMENIRRMADEIGLDKKKFDEGQKKGSYLLKVKEDLGYAAKIGAESPAVIFINGLYFSGTFPYDDLKKLVQQELEQETKTSKE